MHLPECDTHAMRVLLTCRPAFGHYAPLLPLAHALVRAGHQVSFATGLPLVEVIQRDGFEADAAGLPVSELQALREQDPRFAAAVENPRLMRPIHWRLSFGGIEVAPRVNDLTHIVERRRPDLIVHETSEFAGPLVAAM